eukprot:gb/GEZN01005288.1/.p1 GENE.gb/GEZN01005288.1/~~gb/GEZN01005288.1/.p1  ORF type:complete len:574 (-),score=71.44 gb/GEZN01005288.1/:34-1755(-)
MTTPVSRWLISSKLEQYIQLFLDEGFEELFDLAQITEVDLKEMGVKRGHRRRILTLLPKSVPPLLPLSLAPTTTQVVQVPTTEHKSSEPSIRVMKIAENMASKISVGQVTAEIAEQKASKTSVGQVSTTEQKASVRQVPIEEQKNPEPSLGLPTTKQQASDTLVEQVPIAGQKADQNVSELQAVSFHNSDIVAVSFHSNDIAAAIGEKTGSQNTTVIAAASPFLANGGICRLCRVTTFQGGPGPGYKQGFCTSCYDSAEISCLSCGEAKRLKDHFSNSQLRKFPLSKCVSCTRWVRKAYVKIDKRYSESASDEMRQGMTQYKSDQVEASQPATGSNKLMKDDWKAPNWRSGVSKEPSSSLHTISIQQCSWCESFIDNMTSHLSEPLCKQCMSTKIECMLCCQLKLLFKFSSYQRKKKIIKCRYCATMFVKATTEHNGSGADACFQIGLIYRDGNKFFEPNLKQAQQYFEKAARLGHPQARKCLVEVDEPCHAPALAGLGLDARFLHQLAEAKLLHHAPAPASTAFESARDGPNVKEAGAGEMLAGPSASQQVGEHTIGPTTTLTENSYAALIS